MYVSRSRSFKDVATIATSISFDQMIPNRNFNWVHLAPIIEPKHCHTRHAHECILQLME